MSFIRIPLVEANNQPQKPSKKSCRKATGNLSLRVVLPAANSLINLAYSRVNNHPKNSKNNQNAACHSDRA
jgi:hypothetical protein